MLGATGKEGEQAKRRGSPLRSSGENRRDIGRVLSSYAETPWKCGVRIMWRNVELVRIIFSVRK
jgi:hypothetical protein